MTNNCVHDELHQVYDFSNYKLRKIIECRHPNDFREDVPPYKCEEQHSKIEKFGSQLCFINQKPMNSLLLQYDFENDEDTNHVHNHPNNSPSRESYAFHPQNNFQIKTKDSIEKRCEKNIDKCFCQNINGVEIKDKSYNIDIEKTNAYTNTINCMKHKKNNEIELCKNVSCEPRCNDFNDNEDIKNTQQSTCINKIKELVTTLKILNYVDKQQKKGYAN